MVALARGRDGNSGLADFVLLADGDAVDVATAFVPCLFWGAEWFTVAAGILP